MMFPHAIPMVVDMTNGFHFRPEEFLVFCWHGTILKKQWDTKITSSLPSSKRCSCAPPTVCPVSRISRSIPSGAWAGLYDMLPDHHAILGQAPEVPGFFCANGFSGHGAMHAPATGKIVSDLILTWAALVVYDVELLSPERFAKGALLHETAVL